MAPVQLAGVKFAASAFELPAATTTVVLRLRALLIAACMSGVEVHGAPPPRLMLMTLAGDGFAGTPLTVPPEAQTTASLMSDIMPPQAPSTRAMTSFAPGATPETPSALLPSAATVPATCVPCQLLLPAAAPPQAPAAR